LQLVSFNTGDASSFGAVIEGRVVDLGRHLPEYDTLKDLLAANGLVRALDTAAEVSPDYRLDKVTLRTPIPDAEQMLCVFDDAQADPVSIDPKFVRGSNRTLQIPEGDSKPIAAGIVVAVQATDDGHAALGCMLLCYLSPAMLAAGPWLTTPDQLAEADQYVLTVSGGDQRSEMVLPDPTTIALKLAADRSLGTGDLVAVLRYLPELKASPETTLEVSSEELGTLTSPIEAEGE
jgi:hypothetical protein